MSGVSDLTGRSFRRLVVLESLGLSAVTLFLVSLYLWALLRMSPEQLGFFVRCISGLFVVLFVLSTLVNERIHGAIGRCLDRRCEAQAGPEELRSGYAALVALPRISFLVGWAWWAGGGVLVAAAMRIRFQSFPWLSVAIMVVAAVSVGLVSMILHYFVLKRMLEPYHSALAAEVGDVFVRRKLMSHVPLTQKLVITVVGVTAVSLGFAVTLAQVRSDLAIEGFATRLQREALHRASLQLGAGQNLDRVRTASEVVSVRLLLLDAAAEHVIDGPPSLLLADEIRALREVGPEGGDSTAFDTPNAFAWRRLADGTVLVAVSPPDTVWAEYSDVTAILGIFTLLALGIAVTAARLAASDISRVTLALRGEVERMAGGDLTPGRTIESEDEVGHLARGFERMSLALRGTVSGVVDAAGGVEATAGELARVAEDLASVTDDQVLGIQQAKTSMDRINGEVDGVATSAHQLSVSVEESSSAILELGVTGEELSENASVLSERVAEVGTSIEQMSQSAERVRHFSEELAGASADTSASMTEMAQTLGEVDGNAAETARLSHRMVELAETGHQKVAETIRGMDSIREATDTAQSVIHTLGGRAQEIGSIVQVIHDVADETNLLALNAAIIAAQAGEHGRAFSVVADEIKDLADRVITSTKEIDGLIHGLQDESRNAIGAIEGGADRVRVGVEMSAEAGVALEQITAAARESGGRIAEIVSAVQEQSQASAHVVRLMEKVRYGVDQIREAGDEQSQGNAVVLRGANEMRQVAQQVSAATQEQARGAHRMRDGIENIRDAVERINSSLQKQSKGCRQVAEVLERVHGRTHQNDESARRMRDAMSGLSQQAEALRQGVRHFRV